MKKNLVLAAGLATLLCAHSASAAPPLALSAKGSTMGYGLEMTCGLSPKFNLRAGYIGGPTSRYSLSAEETDYDADVKFRSASALMDWHPASGPFHLSTGLYLNHNRLTGVATPAVGYLINGRAYTGAEIGSLSTEIGFSALAPYLGLGWGNAVGDGNRFGLVLDVGVLFQGPPKVHLKASGELAADETLQSDLQSEEASLQEMLAPFKLYPVVSLGVRFKL